MNQKSSFVLDLLKIDGNDELIVGQKAMRIAKLASMGINVSPGFVVTANTYFNFLKEHNLPPKITALLSTVHFQSPESVMQVSGHIKKLLKSYEINDSVVDEIFKRYKILGGVFKDAKVNIISSPLDEGIAIDQYKNVTGEENLLYRIEDIWNNFFSPAQLIYRHQHALNPQGLGGGVIIQKTLDSKIAGQLFTSSLLIKTDSRLNKTQIAQLENIGKKIKKHLYIPQEVSWVITKNKVFVTDIKPLTEIKKTYLVLVRHGESEWNAKGLWTGWTDVELSQTGHEQAKDAGYLLKDTRFDISYTSSLTRAQQTLSDIKTASSQLMLPTIKASELNERNYGDLTGKNKWKIKEEYGDEQFHKWRRGWADTVPNGESLKDVYNRVVPYFETTILPQLKSGKNVLIAAHGNSLRALVKHLENLTDRGVEELEIGVGEVYVYTFNEDGKIIDKQIRNQHENKV